MCVWLCQRFRGEAMQTAVPQGMGAMAALMPVSARDAEEICRLAAQQTQRVCQVANYNSSKQVRVWLLQLLNHRKLNAYYRLITHDARPQIVISGDAQAVDAAIQIAKTEKKVRRAVLLDVSAPFHCTLMEPAALKLNEFLTLETSVSLRAPDMPVVWNVEASASEKSSSEIIANLTKQVTSPVMWSQSVDFCLENGVDEFLEIGFGGVLTGVIKQHAPKANARYDFLWCCPRHDTLKTVLHLT